jgi:hypothetical protein
MRGKSLYGQINAVKPLIDSSHGFVGQPTSLSVSKMMTSSTSGDIQTPLHRG